jgi:lactaldehyde dehydrogenase / glycolaldehyde dehydrogenase
LHRKGEELEMTPLIESIAPESAYIDGAWLNGRGPSFDIFDPTTGEVLTALATSSDADVESALAAAARVQPEWAATPIRARGDYVRAIADVFRENEEQLARIIVKEVGKPMTQALGELAFAQAFLRYNADWDVRLEGDILPGDVPYEVIHLMRVPLGVVAAICPWNFPLAVLCRKIAPALVTGNTVVAKPSEISPLSTMFAFNLIAEKVGLPAGVLNMVNGHRPVGQALVRSALTSLVSFTGHRDTGKQVVAEAANNLTRTSLELGGKAPAIVWKDADLDLAVRSIIEARHTNAGQACTSAERVLVHNQLLDEFIERYLASTLALRVGDPNEDVDMGPLVSSAQYAKSTEAVGIAIDEGARLLAGGGRPAGGDLPAGGYWFAPTVLGNINPSMTVMTEETFGPITPIIGIDSLDEALQIANDSRYGLSAYIFSRDYQTVMRTVNELAFGEIYVNRTLGESVHAHHAGFKESGIGGEDGKWGLLRYTQIKTAYHRYG